IAVQLEGTIDPGIAIDNFSANVGKREAGGAKSPGVVLADLDGAPRKPGGLHHIARPVERPAERVALDIGTRGKPIRRSVARIEIDGSIKVSQRIGVAFTGPAVQAGHAAQEIVVSVEALGGLAVD